MSETTTEIPILHISLSENWLSEDLAYLLILVEEIYSEFIIFSMLNPERMNKLDYSLDIESTFKFVKTRDVDFFFSLSRFIPVETKLKIHSIRISSPGEINLVNFSAGEIIRELRELLNDLIHHSKNKELRDLDLEIKRLEVIEKRIEILKNLGYSNSKIRNIIGLSNSRFDQFRLLGEYEKVSSIDILA